MLQHVGMDREGEARRLASYRDDLADRGRGERAPPLRGEHVGTGRPLLPLEAPQGTKLWAPKRMGGRQAALEPAHVEQPIRQ